MRLSLDEALEQVRPSIRSTARYDLQSAADTGYHPRGYYVHRGMLIMEISGGDMRRIIDEWSRTRETPAGLYLSDGGPGDRPRWTTLDGNDCECYCEDWYSLDIALRWLTEPGTDVGYLYELDRKAHGRRGGVA